MDLLRLSARLSSRIGLVFAVGALAACAGRAHGVLGPTHMRAPGTSLVDMMVETTRAPVGDPGEMFSGERGNVSFADIAVSIPPDANRQIGDVQWPSEGETPNPLLHFTTVEARVLNREQAIAAFDARIKRTPKRQALVFVHGFNTRFEDAVYRFAQITHDSGADFLPVLFTWPSRGKLLQYGYDLQSANYSRDALENLLQFLVRDPNVGEVSILAHSMGNWVTLEALRQMAIRDHGLPAKIRNVMLASPDVDYDVFNRQIATIDSRSTNFSIFVSRDDEALAVSKRIWGDKPRLGAIDPAEEPYRDQLKRDRVQAIDLSDVKTEDRLGHTKFAEAPEVVRAIGARLATGQELNDARVGVGDRLGLAAAGAVSTVGTAAGVAVAAPFAIVDPRTRENFTERFGAIGENAEDTIRAGADIAR